MRMSNELVALLILCASVLLNLVTWVAKRRQLYVRGSQRALLIQDITELRREVAKYNTPSTFARSAKCQRQVNAKEKELAQLESSSAPGDKWTATTQKVVRIAKVAGAVACTAYCYGKPMAFMAPELLLPLQRRILALPHGSDFSSYGAIAVVPWMLVCDRAAGMLVQAVLPPAQIQLPATKPSAPAGSEPQAEDKKDL